ncbi:hypothetical protein Chor_015184 [Crotalus horridus]
MKLLSDSALRFPSMPAKLGLFCTYYQLNVVCIFLSVFFQTENFLKHKIRSRPDRSELVRMHILEEFFNHCSPFSPETFAEPSLQATQMKLKRARLADDLNEKIAQRPGPMELVEKNILPVDSSVKEAIIGK